ncbi:hypothetical protein M427DRAFT_58648 [Gonapodya prolifera JEL478]|uniref:Uncharacterized protein n=1 Tax=Gonapodya prolifera (strain JEL478) TaxID=1344416 RepID=A0A139A9S8_GONPJ|nr:hypothetical protein M427DRAFT_58648 [Gonapodya prolifera JEL478]|eukprot:KXS13404.1 hypothetical protein M427DRAFT_58648 [Gonapodya prolifera JEL478]
MVTINLDRADVADDLHIDGHLIAHHLDTFTELQSASFHGCLSSSSCFLGEATQNNRIMEWCSRKLRLLDLSDTKQRVRKHYAYGLSNKDTPKLITWEGDEESTDLMDIDALFQGSKIELFPRLCDCEKDPVYSWSAFGCCEFCDSLGPCFQCGVSPSSQLPRSLQKLSLECRGIGCTWRSQMCQPCSIYSRWMECPIADCESEICPLCVQRTCSHSDKPATTCRDHCDHRCSCGPQCMDCLRTAACELGGSERNCVRCRGIKCVECSRFTCRLCIAPCPKRACKDTTCRDCHTDASCAIHAAIEEDLSED